MQHQSAYGEGKSCSTRGVAPSRSHIFSGRWYRHFHIGAGQLVKIVQRLEHGDSKRSGVAFEAEGKLPRRRAIETCDLCDLGLPREWQVLRLLSWKAARGESIG